MLMLLYSLLVLDSSIFLNLFILIHVKPLLYVCYLQLKMAVSLEEPCQAQINF